MTEHDVRKLEEQVEEAKQCHLPMGDLADNHLLAVLLRLNHQDLALEAIKDNVKSMSGDLKILTNVVAGHVAKDEEIKDSIDDIVSFYKGSKLMGKVTAWLVGIGAAVLGAYVSLKKMLVS